MTTTSTQARVRAGVPHPAGSIQIQYRVGPTCEGTQEYSRYMCGHNSCESIAIERAHYVDPMCPDSGLPDDPDDLFFCLTHWEWAAVDETNSFEGTGFAGGHISHVAFTCGCRYDDESDDERAAV